MRKFCLTVDDNILFFKDLTENNYDSIFENDYLRLFRELHELYGLKVQFNLFYETDGFNLSMMTDRYKNEWVKNSSWLKMSFHARAEFPNNPYLHADYAKLYQDCKAVNDEIIRFAGCSTLAETTTVHFCVCPHDALRAMKDNGYKGLLGLFGGFGEKATSYSIPLEKTEPMRHGKLLVSDGISFGAIDIVLNLQCAEENVMLVKKLLGNDRIKIMIHEQYFHKSYAAYHPRFREEIEQTVSTLVDSGYESCFFEEVLISDAVLNI